MFHSSSSVRQVKYHSPASPSNTKPQSWFHFMLNVAYGGTVEATLASVQRWNQNWRARARYARARCATSNTRKFFTRSKILNFDHFCPNICKVLAESELNDLHWKLLSAADCLAKSNLWQDVMIFGEDFFITPQHTWVLIGWLRC